MARLLDLWRKLIDILKTRHRKKKSNRSTYIIYIYIYKNIYLLNFQRNKKDAEDSILLSKVYRLFKSGFFTTNLNNILLFSYISTNSFKTKISNTKFQSYNWI